MKKEFIVRFKNENSVELLRKIGIITYQSLFINVLFIETNKNKNEILKIEGVLEVDLSNKVYNL